ncbi:MAG: AtpZ/AtpI family protein [Candidatus Pacebacteria bacterium]|nr:AtpZ/AtpI family protein [Candidatus Paceibacterota bacterium]
MKNTKNNVLYALGLGTQLGLLIALPLVACLFAGIAVDKKLGTSPLYLIVGILLGAILTVADVYKLILPFLEKRSKKNDLDNNKK